MSRSYDEYEIWYLVSDAITFVRSIACFQGKAISGSRANHDSLSTKNQLACEVLHACASLGLSLHPENLHRLVEQVLSGTSSELLCDVAWSLAAVDKLTTSVFVSLLQALCSEVRFSVDQSGFDKLLLQAFHSLQPFTSDAQEVRNAWHSLCQRSHSQKLAAVIHHSAAASLVQDALRHLELEFGQDATLGPCQPDAVLKHKKDSTPVVLVAAYVREYARNDPGR